MNEIKKMTITANNKSLKMNRYTKLLSVMGILAIAMFGMVILDDSDDSDAVSQTYDAKTLFDSYSSGSMVETTASSVTINTTNWEQGQGPASASASPSSFTLSSVGSTSSVTLTKTLNSNVVDTKSLTFKRVAEIQYYQIGVGVYQSIGGTASVLGGGESTSSSGSTSYVTVADNSLMTFTATPASGYHFVKWIAGSDEAFPTDNPTGFIVMGKDMTFRAVFEADPSPTSSTSYTLYLQPGQAWAWTPTFPEDLSPTVLIAASSSSMPSYSTTFSATSGYAEISSGTITVTIPSSFSGDKYYLLIKASTTQPTQIKYYEITFNVATYHLTYNTSTVYAKVGTAITDMSPSFSPSGIGIKSYALTGTLPTGLSFSTSTGKITGTPTAYKAQANYTVTVTLNTVPVQRTTATLSIGAYTNITTTNYTVYAITNETAISVPGTSMPTGTVLDKMTLTATKNNANASVTAGTAYKGMTVAANTGAVSGTPTEAGTYIFTQKYDATVATGGSTSTRTVTVVVEDKVAITSNSTLHSFYTHEDSATLTKTGPSNVSWSITKITKNGSAISSGTDYNSFTLSSAGVLKSSTATTAGTYIITVKATTTNTTNNTSGATGATTASNSITKDITFAVADKIAMYPASIYLYETEDKVYDPVSAQAVNSSDSSHGAFANATYSFSAYGTGLDATKISINSSTGAITPGSSALARGDYTATIQVQDPNNPANTATGTLNVHVVRVLAFTNEPSSGSIISW